MEEERTIRARATRTINALKTEIDNVQSFTGNRPRRVHVKQKEYDALRETNRLREIPGVEIVGVRDE